MEPVTLGEVMIPVLFVCNDHLLDAIAFPFSFIWDSFNINTFSVESQRKTKNYRIMDTVLVYHFIPHYVYYDFARL